MTEAAEPIVTRDPAAAPVTVIIPAAHPTERLRDVLASVAAQQHRSVECLVVGGEAVAPVAAEFSCARHVPEFSADENAAVNRGWAMAAGDYVAILPPLAPQPPHWLSTSVGWMEAHPWILAAYPDWEEDGRAVQAPEWDLERAITEARMLPGPGALLRRALLPIATLRDPTFGSAAEFMSWALIGLQGAVMRIPVCAAAGPRAQPHGLVHHACLARAVAAFFEDPDLPAVLRHWRPRAKSRAAECLVAAFGEEDGTRAARLGAAALAVRLYGGSIGVRPLVKAAAPQSVLGLLKRAVIVAETANARVQLWRYHRSLRR